MRAGRARQASLSGRGARGVQASGRAGAGGRTGAQGRAERRRAGGSARGRRRRGRAGWACWLVSWASFGAQCTWLSFDSVFDPVQLGISLSHIMNTVHCKINFRKKKIFIKFN